MVWASRHSQDKGTRNKDEDIGQTDHRMVSFALNLVLWLDDNPEENEPQSLKVQTRTRLGGKCEFGDRSFSGRHSPLLATPNWLNKLMLVGCHQGGLF